MNTFTVAMMLGMMAVGLLVGCQADSGRTGPRPGPVELGGLDAAVLGEADQEAGREMVRAEIRSRIRAACEREDRAWAQVRSAGDWEKFRDERMAALRRSLGGALAWVGEKGPTRAPELMVTGVFGGEGFVIQNLVIAGRADLPITANLYLPDPRPAGGMPGILICTSHHNGKSQGEMLDMGMTWARAGAMVLVIDNLGYIERRQHPEGFVPRENYRWRYYLGMQLYTVGESLIGWMVDDLHRGIDVLLTRPGVDPERIVAMGSVAGGGDPVAVLAALDGRIRCVIPFNFGSTRVRRSPGADAGTGQGQGAGAGEWIDYVGGGDFETTRCLRNSARDGFVPWLLVGSAAPRPLVFAKEFAWDPDKDPGYARIVQVYGLYGAADKLDSVRGYGSVSQSSAEASHASNVGPHHRKQIYPILERWLDMPVPTEYRTRPKVELLTCMTPEAAAKFPQRKVYQIGAEIAREQLAQARKTLDALSPADRKAKLRADWDRVLGGVEPAGPATVKRIERALEGPASSGPGAAPRPRQSVALQGLTVEKLLLTTEPGIDVPAVLLVPGGLKVRPPVVVCVAQQGKAAFLSRRADEVARLLEGGVAVCLIDVRGTGETRPPGGRVWYQPAVEIAAEELMTGRVMLGSRLRDLRGVLGFLRARADLDGGRLAVWGDSFADMNPADYVDPPLQTKLRNELAEPLGAQLAMLAGLYEDDVRAVLARGGLVGFEAVMDGPACHMVMDGIVPGVLSAGDLADVAAALAPRPLAVERAVTGRNILADPQRLERTCARTRAAYADRPERFRLSPAEDDPVNWLVEALRGE